MHTYTARWPEKVDLDNLPQLEDYRFTNALDVVAWAEQDRLIGWKTWPDVWHLDDTGAFTCYYKASSLSSVKRWAEEPWDLYSSRTQGLAEGGCGSRWLIIESRQQWGADGPIIDEGDAAAFVVVRRHLEEIGVTLVDDVVFDDERHWWSLQELTTGSTDWPVARS